MYVMYVLCVMYVCMYVCNVMWYDVMRCDAMYVCMYVWDVCNVCMSVCSYACMYVCMYVGVYVGMSCMYGCNVLWCDVT